MLTDIVCKIILILAVLTYKEEAKMKQTFSYQSMCAIFRSNICNQIQIVSIAIHVYENAVEFINLFFEGVQKIIKLINISAFQTLFLQFHDI